MDIEHVEKNNVLVVTPKEKRLDVSAAPAFKQKMSQFVENGQVNIVVNLSKVDLIDSSGLGALVSVLKKVGKQGEIKVCQLKENIKSLFQLTRLDKVFEIYRTEDEAVESFE